MRASAKRTEGPEILTPGTVALTADGFRAAMASFAAGVTVVTTLDDAEEPQAVTATAFSSVSLDPPLCLVCIDRRGRTYRPLLFKRRFAVNILRADQAWISSQFASTRPDRFARVPWRRGLATGCPLIENALAWMECEVAEVHSGGDHDIFLGRPAAVAVSDGEPLVYWRGSYSSLPPPPSEPSASAANRHEEATDVANNLQEESGLRVTGS
jgi:3-hydroxy-9,10-secoandrosta-1,3,5(10)-triene-9,17-dione monooxygenase reductase component